MCDRIFPRSNRHCSRPPEFVLLVEATGEEIQLCPDCAAVYNNNQPVTYAPRRPGHEPTYPR